jgi:hypothetical protein
VENSNCNIARGKAALCAGMRVKAIGFFFSVV